MHCEILYLVRPRMKFVFLELEHFPQLGQKDLIEETRERLPRF